MYVVEVKGSIEGPCKLMVKQNKSEYKECLSRETCLSTNWHQSL